MFAIERGETFDSVFYNILNAEVARIHQREKREDFYNHIELIKSNFKQIEYRMILVRYSDSMSDAKLGMKMHDDHLYKAFTRYE